MKTKPIIAFGIVWGMFTGCKSTSLDSNLKDLQVEKNGVLTIMAHDATDGMVKVRTCPAAIVDAAIEKAIDEGRTDSVLPLDFSGCDVKDGRYPDLPLSIYKALLAFRIGAKDLSGENGAIGRAMFDLKSFLRASGAKMDSGADPGQRQISNEEMLEPAIETIVLGNSNNVSVEDFFNNDEVFGEGEAQRYDEDSKALETFRSATFADDFKPYADKLVDRISSLMDLKRRYWAPNRKFEFIMHYVDPTNSQNSNMPKTSVISERSTAFATATFPFSQIAEVGGLAKYEQAAQELAWQAGREEDILDALDGCGEGRLPTKQELLAKYISSQLVSDQNLFQRQGAKYWVADDMAITAAKTSFQVTMFQPSTGKLEAITFTIDDLKAGSVAAGFVCVNGAGKKQYDKSGVISAIQAELDRIESVRQQQAAQEAKASALDSLKTSYQNWQYWARQYNASYNDVTNKLATYNHQVKVWNSYVDAGILLPYSVKQDFWNAESNLDDAKSTRNRNESLRDSAKATYNSQRDAFAKKYGYYPRF